MQNVSRFFILLPILTFYWSCGSKHDKIPSEIPEVSLMVWDDKAKEGSDPAEFRLYQSGQHTEYLTVHVEISGTARNGSDYTPVKNSIRIKNDAPLRIYPIDDLLPENEETVIITLLEDPSYSINPEHKSKKIDIQDDEIPDVQFAIPAWIEKESIPDAVIKVVLSEEAREDIKVDYSVSGLLAREGEDFNLSSGSLVIPAGKHESDILLRIVNDQVAEDDETVILELTSATGANIGLNEKHFYTLVNDDGEVERSIIHDKILGIIVGTRAASSMGAVVEMVVDMDQIERIYGVFDKLIPYVHYNDSWTHPAGGTEDGIERQKLMCTSIIKKQNGINAEDLARTWIDECEIEEMYHMTQPYDRILLSYAKWGVPLDEFPRTRYGMPYDLGEHIHLTARVFHALPCINAGNPEGVIEDMKEIGRLYYENKNDDAFAWGAVYNAALTLAMLPGSTVDSVIQDALEYGTPEIREEIQYGLSLAAKYDDPMDRGFRKDLNQMYTDPASPYCVDNRIQEYPQSSIYENVTCAFAIFKATGGNVEQAVIITVNRGRDTDCTAASAAGLAGAFSGTSTIPPEWFGILDEGTMNNPYTNSHLTNKATADGLYRALINKTLGIKKQVDESAKNQSDNLSEELRRKQKYIDLMQRLGII